MGNVEKKNFKLNEIFKEFGEMPSQGRRTDLIDLRDRIKSGESVDDLTIENPEIFHQYGRTLTKLEDIILRKKYRTWMTEGIWYWGSTGVGKSHKAFENYDPETHYVYPNDNGWWDGYTGQETVIINDFRGGICYNELLDLVDKWPKDVKRRCREPAPFLARKVIITSPDIPQNVYSRLAENDSLDQLFRRFKIIHCKSPRTSGGHGAPWTRFSGGEGQSGKSTQPKGIDLRASPEQ
eukprot:GHVU01115306.1.p1 GENE.GHVU01115306.1~~GHVU01115306.1.p1  ORF type:complete len:237 (+),score=15.01 GHVU01115306.1:377-1087(+)